MVDLVNIFQQYGYIIKTFNNSSDTIEELLKEISLDESIGIGGSTTIQELGVYELLQERGNEVHWHWKAENKKEALELAKQSSVYISSVNAITEDGKIINIDGTGNRVASMIYGHKNVFLIIGKNKVCKNYDEAVDRIRTVAAPKNAERLKINTPCRFTGKCNDCDSPDRMCNAEVVLHRKPKGTNIHIYLVDEELGY